MRILMLGWELPPVFAGGVGTVCNEIARALSEKDNEIIYIMPSGPKDMQVDHIKKLLIANNIYANAKIQIKKIDTLLSAYQSSEEYANDYQKYLAASGDSSNKTLYGTNLLEEVYRFAAKVALLVKEEHFDVIHAHDWTTFPAAIAAKIASGKPLVVHMHITEFNKSGGMHANSHIYAIEKEGMEKADAVIAISHLIKDFCTNKYFINPEKIHVVHNAAITMNDNVEYATPLNEKEKVVLFTGRVTLQKGPDYFVETAKLVLDKNPDVTFIMGGTGDMLPKVIDRAAQLGISHKFIFHGFYTREQAEKLYSMADVYIMPSVCEPFGVVAYEAMAKRKPTIVSKQSGISEVVNHCLKVDFWDTRRTAAQILALLHYPTLNQTMGQNGYVEAKTNTWEKPATQCINIYNKLRGG